MTGLTMHEQQGLTDYLTVLFWLETASTDQIHGALYLAQGEVKTDLELAIKTLMQSDRPALAKDFPHLLPDRLYLRDLATEHDELATAIKILQTSIDTNSAVSTSSPKGYGRVLGSLRSLQAEGSINAAQLELLTVELQSIISNIYR